MDGLPRASEAAEGSNPVLPTSYSHFSWRRPRGMVFGGQQEQQQTMLMVQTACLCLVWMWRKIVVKMYPLWPKVSLKWLMVGENFENTPFSTGNCLVRLVSPCCNSVCAFAPVFSEKSAIFSAKVAKT